MTALIIAALLAVLWAGIWLFKTLADTMDRRHRLTGGAANHNAGAASRSVGGSRMTATCNGRGAQRG